MYVSEYLQDFRGQLVDTAARIWPNGNRSFVITAAPQDKNSANRRSDRQRLPRNGIEQPCDRPLANQRLPTTSKDAAPQRRVQDQHGCEI